MKKLILIFCLIISNIVYASDVKILHTSDIHGRIAPVKYNNIQDCGGFSRRVNYVQNLRNDNKNVLLLDSGDYFQGSLYYKLDKGRKIAKLLQYIKYDAIALGNHEFDNGLNILKRNIKLSKTTFLSANVHFNDKFLKKNVKPYIERYFDGEKFLIIGVTTPNIKNLSQTEKITVSDPIFEIKNIIKKISYDKLIILSHCGFNEDINIAKSIPQIDLILGGHNHLFFDKPYLVGKTAIIQDGEFGIRFGYLDFDNKIKIFEPQYINNQIESNLNIDSLISKMDKHNKSLSEKYIAKTNVTLIGQQNIIESQQTNLGKLILISMATPFGKDYDGIIINSGSIRINRNLNGIITYADLMEMLPFENDIVMIEIKGKDLKNALKYGQEPGRHYLQYYLHDSKIDENKMYKIVTNNYLAKGKDGYKDFKNSKIIKKSNKKPLTLIKNLLRKKQIITEDSFII